MRYSIKYFKEKDLLPSLAYETGIHLGDGYLGYCYDKYQNGFKFLIQYTGGSVNELHFYKTILKPLLFKLYKINKPIKLKKDNSCVIHTRLKSLALFKKSIGLPVGKKINIKIPNFISSKLLKINFIRGLFDTDSSLSFQKKYKKIHYYPVIHYASNNKHFTLKISRLLNELNIKHNTYFNEISRDSRIKKGYTIKHNIFICGKIQLGNWMRCINFYSSKHLTKYLIWKKLGYLPQNTTTEQRLKMLKKFKIDYASVAQIQ